MAFPITSGQSTILSLVQNGGAFNTGILTNISSCSSGLISSASSIEALAATSGAGLVYTGFAGLSSQLTTITASGGALDTLSSHIESQFTSLTNNAGLYIGQLNLQQGLKQVGSSLSSLSGIDLSGNICAGLNTFFGSIMGAGQGLLDIITGAIQDIAGVIAFGINVTQEIIDAAVSTITGIIGTIVGAATAILSMVANEVQALANALADLLVYGVTSALSALFNNPCGKLLLEGVGTAGLLSALAL